MATPYDDMRTEMESHMELNLSWLEVSYIGVMFTIQKYLTNKWKIHQDSNSMGELYIVCNPELTPVVNKCLLCFFPDTTIKIYSTNDNPNFIPRIDLYCDYKVNPIFIRQNTISIAEHNTNEQYIYNVSYNNHIVYCTIPQEDNNHINWWDTEKDAQCICEWNSATVRGMEQINVQNVLHWTKQFALCNS